MLTKSMARAFFVSGTAVCSLAFVGLTVDTFGQIPRLTREAELTPAAIHGKELWESSNCMGCHTLFGEGGYYAPELTKVMERRGEPFVRAILKDPEAMYPGQRRMQNYKFSEEQIDHLVAFFEWAGQVDLQGFPPRPHLVPMAVPDEAEGSVARADNRPMVYNQLCVACHTLGGQGGSVGPALDGVGERFDADYLKKWIRDPSAVKPGAKMPKLPISDEQLDELVAFLSHQSKTPAANAAPTGSSPAPSPVKEPTP